MSVNSLPAHKRANIRAFFQPWASLMVMGAKTFETTSLPAPASLIKTHILIEASANSSQVELREQAAQKMAQVLQGLGQALDTLPRGMVIGSAFLHGCYKIKGLARGLLELEEERVGCSDPELTCIHLTKQELLFGCYRPGRWIWHLTKPCALLGEWEAGTVKWFSEHYGYGFITRADGADVFVHHSILPRGVIPLSGTPAQVRIGHGAKGLMAAEVVLDGTSGTLIRCVQAEPATARAIAA